MLEIPASFLFRTFFGAFFCWGVLMATGIAAEKNRGFTVEEEAWWAVQPVKEVDAPNGEHPIDGFILRKLEGAGLEMASEASAEEFVRRATFDLHGLPPTPEQVRDFAKAWEKDSGLTKVAPREYARGAVEATVAVVVAMPRIFLNELARRPLMHECRAAVVHDNELRGASRKTLTGRVSAVVE